MQVEPNTISGPTLQQSRGVDSIDMARRSHEKGGSSQEKAGTAERNVQPEEIIDQIKSLTEDGLYSVRFEQSPDLQELVVKIVDTSTDEVIRQVPAEEVLGLRASLAELRGQIVDTVR